MAKIMTTAMNDVIVVNSEDSDNSIVEVEVPKKPTPPLIQIEDEDIFLNIVQLNQRPVLATNFISEEQSIAEMSEEPENLHTIISPDHWTPDMMKFYNDDWGDEDQFVVEKIQEKMNKTPSLWKISRKDEAQPYLRRGKIKCWNCFQRGHHFSVCPDSLRSIKCHMCGIEGHSNYSCPNSKCLNCGNQAREFVLSCRGCFNQKHQICSRCNLFGHNFINCSDHWRLFHLTTGTTSVTIPNQNIYKSDIDIWCSNCGKRGHHQIYCTERKDCGGFADTLPFVTSYHIAFNVNPRKNKGKEAPLRRIKGKNKEKNKSEKILNINPISTAFRKHNTKFKNNFKRFKGKKRSRHKNKGKKGWDGLFA